MTVSVHHAGSLQSRKISVAWMTESTLADQALTSITKLREVGMLIQHRQVEGLESLHSSNKDYTLVCDSAQAARRPYMISIYKLSLLFFPQSGEHHGTL